MKLLLENNQFTVTGDLAIDLLTSAVSNVLGRLRDEGVSEHEIGILWRQIKQKVEHNFEYLEDPEYD